MEMRLEKNNCNSFRKTRNFYSENTQITKICVNFNWGGYSVIENTQTNKICLNCNFGGYSVTENTQSTKICLNCNFRGGIL